MGVLSCFCFGFGLSGFVDYFVGGCVWRFDLVGFCVCLRLRVWVVLWW